MFAKLFVAAFVVVAVGVVLWTTGAISQDGDAEGKSVDRRETLPLERWAYRVGVICAWEKREMKPLIRQLRTMSSFRDAELWFRAVSRLGNRSVAMFRRLPPPRGHRREFATVLSLYRRQMDAVDAMGDAVRANDARALFRQAKRIFRLHDRASRILVRLGVERCTPTKKEKLPSERRLLV
jgi:hypothetical protein